MCVLVADPGKDHIAGRVLSLVLVLALVLALVLVGTSAGTSTSTEQKKVSHLSCYSNTFNPVSVQLIRQINRFFCTLP